MSRPLQMHIPVSIQNRRIGSHLARQGSTSKNEIEIGQNRAVGRQNISRTGNFTGQSLHNTQDFLLACNSHLPHGVIQLDNGEWFNKQCRAACGLIVNNTWKLAAIFLLDRDDIAFIAHSDNSFLKHFLIGCIVKNGRKPILYPRLRRTQLIRDTMKDGAGIIAKISVFVNRCLKIPFQHAQDFDAPRQVFQQLCISRQIAKKILHVSHAANGALDQAQLIQLQQDTSACLFKNLLQMMDAIKWRRLNLCNPYCLFGLPVKLCNVVIVGRWHDTAASFFPIGCGGIRCESGFYFFVF